VGGLDGSHRGHPISADDVREGKASLLPGATGIPGVVAVPPRGKLIAAFERPHGFSGRWVGPLLVIFHSELNRRAVSRMDLDPTGRALEIGFGPGVALRLLDRRVPKGSVTGIDPSGTMIRQAARRNLGAIKAGSVRLTRGVAGHLPYRDRSFDAVLSLNNILLWGPLEGALREVWRVLRPGGQFVAAAHEWALRGQSAPQHGGPAQVGHTLEDALARAAFRDRRIEVIHLRIGRALLVTAYK
jgi:SAM-dependent methyltransferase